MNKQIIDWYNQEKLLIIEKLSEMVDLSNYLYKDLNARLTKIDDVLLRLDSNI